MADIPPRGRWGPRKTFAITTTGNAQAVAAAATGVQHVVVGFVFSAGSNAALKSATTALLHDVVSSAGSTPLADPEGICATVAGEALNLDADVAGGIVVYHSTRE